MATQTQTEPRQTKTAFVRGVLKEIGAISKNPPEGWRQQVEEALKKQGLDMHTVTIYQIRQKALQEKQGGKAASKGKQRKGPAKAAAPAPTPAAVPSVNGNITVADLKAVQEFSQRFGGLAGLTEAVKALESFKQ